MAKVSHAQEPSMEEILASIRRIISDEETGGKPSAPSSFASPAPSLSVVNPQPAGGSASEPIPPRRPLTDALAASAPAPASAPAAPPVAKIASAMDDVILELSEAQVAPNFALSPDTSSDMDISFVDDIPPKAPSLPPPAMKVEIHIPPAAPRDVTPPAPPPAARVETPTLPPPPVVPIAEAPQPAPAAAEPSRPAQPGPAQARPAQPKAAPETQVAREPLMSERADEAVNTAFNHLASTILSANARTLEDLVKEMMRPMLKSWLDDNLPGLVERLVREEIERVSRGRR